ncbi:MAG TPA: Imm70 family immunity protein, partial [Pirellulales bacterium]|nr:Imm70 family immunity protein [Pirellulales bacterium]
MGLYFCVFDDDEELDGVEVGGYDDFNSFRSAVTGHLEKGRRGSSFPTLILHSDCDGEWTAELCGNLANELQSIKGAFLKLPPVHFESGWQKSVAM